MSEQALEQPTNLSETALELTQAPNSIFRRALFGGYKTQDVDPAACGSRASDRALVCP